MRPTKLTPAVQQKIVDAITVGAIYELAAQYAGIAYATFNNWMARGRAEAARLETPGARPRKSETPYLEFLEAVKKAEGSAAVGWLAVIERAATETWQAAAWKLERRYPKDYGRQVQEQAGEIVLRVQREDKPQ